MQRSKFINWLLMCWYLCCNI